MKKQLALILSLAALFAMCMPAFAAGASVMADSVDSVTLENLDIPADEVLVKMNEDGSFVTEKISDVSTFAAQECRHDEIIKDGPPLTEKVSYGGAYADKCYKKRTVEQSYCSRCHKRFKVYGPWTDVNHSYPFIGKKICKVCHRHK